MNILGMGWEEMMIILVGALLIFGPDRLPEVAGQIGKFIRDIRKMTGDLTGELERTAGVGDIKKAVQNELAGVKTQVNAATKTVQSTAASAASSVNKTVTSATSTSKTTSTAVTKPATTSTTGKSTTSTATPAPAPKPVASKKDPWADVSFFDDPIPAAEPATKPVSAATATAAASPSGRGEPKLDQIDALGRARQRRLSAGYNRRAS